MDKIIIIDVIIRINKYKNVYIKTLNYIYIVIDNAIFKIRLLFL